MACSKDGKDTPMTARLARTIVHENDDELGYWIEVNRHSMFAGFRQKSAAVTLLFQELAALPQVAKGRFRRDRQHARVWTAWRLVT
jgi:hypothetical protein